MMTARVDGQAVKLSADEVRAFALVGMVLSRHYQRRAKSKGKPTVFNQMRKQGLPQDMCAAVLGLHKISVKEIA